MLQDNIIVEIAIFHYTGLTLTYNCVIIWSFQVSDADEKNNLNIRQFLTLCQTT